VQKGKLMIRRSEKMRLAAIFSPTGGHVASWRHPDSPADGAINIDRYVEWAQLAEAAKFDLVFLADNLGLKDANVSDLSRTASSIAFIEPITALSAVAMKTSKIGLVSTASTTYTEPYNLARMFASLDHISHGRAGWNLVTSAQPTEAENFTLDKQIDHATRYERAEEYADVVFGLWDSWAPGALIRDKVSGHYFDPQKMKRLNHEGKFFKVKGPLNVMRSPQGRPTIFQAGSSGPGMNLAARISDCVFTAQPTMAGAIAFYNEIKQLAAGFGRSPDHIKVMPGIFPVVGATEEEARRKLQELQDLVHPELGLSILSAAIGGGLDFSHYDIDGPVPDLPLTTGNQTFQAKLLETARRDNLTIRQLYLRYASGYGHRQIIGSVEQVADELEESFHAGAADGFALSIPWLPGSLKDFADMVVPELQRRGLFRTEYEADTLRENLGIPSLT
jgi:FMN-dependent oxidoreductase (nitrilotriacetate monooxygenase family)